MDISVLRTTLQHLLLLKNWLISFDELQLIHLPYQLAVVSQLSFHQFAQVHRLAAFSILRSYNHRWEISEMIGVFVPSSWRTLVFENNIWFLVDFQCAINIFQEITHLISVACFSSDSFFSLRSRTISSNFWFCSCNSSMLLSGKKYNTTACCDSYTLVRHEKLCSNWICVYLNDTNFSDITWDELDTSSEETFRSSLPVVTTVPWASSNSFSSIRTCNRFSFHYLTAQEHYLWLAKSKSINLSAINSPVVQDLYFVVLNAGFLSWPVRIFFYCYQILVEGSHIPIKKQMNNYYSWSYKTFDKN